MAQNHQTSQSHIRLISTLLSKQVSNVMVSTGVRMIHTTVNAAAFGNHNGQSLIPFFTHAGSSRVEPELQVCNICDSSSHTTVSCPLNLCKQPPLAGKPNVNSTWGDERWRCDLLIQCAEFNAKGIGFFKDKCKYH